MRDIEAGITREPADCDDVFHVGVVLNGGNTRVKPEENIQLHSTGWLEKRTDLRFVNIGEGPCRTSHPIILRSSPPTRNQNNQNGSCMLNWKSATRIDDIRIPVIPCSDPRFVVVRMPGVCDSKPCPVRGAQYG